MSTEAQSRTDWSDNLATLLEPHLGLVRVLTLVQIPGGASKQTWALDLETTAGKLEAILRRAGGGTINSETLSLEQEFRVLKLAFQSGVKVPEPLLYVPDCAGQEAILMRRVGGESLGRRVVSRPELMGARAELPKQIAEEFAKIHRLPLTDLEFLPGPRGNGGHAPKGANLPSAGWVSTDLVNTVPHWIARLRQELDAVGEPHPVIELALVWLEQHAPAPTGHALLHGDLRLGNVLVGPNGLKAVIDWEFAHVGDPAEDLAWPLVRAWRFGHDNLRFAGVGKAETFLAHYNTLTKRDAAHAITLEHLFFWEVMGNVKWAVGALTQARRHLNGFERSIEYAVLGRLASEVEFELLCLLRHEFAAGTSPSQSW